MSNPLKDKNALAISPAEEQAQIVDLLDTNKVSVYNLQQRKAYIEEARQVLDADSKEKNLEAVVELNKHINDLMKLVADPSLAASIAGSIETGKDYNEFVKAVAGVARLRDELLDKTMDFNTSSGKRKRIEVAFQGQGVKMALRVETDEG